MYKPHILSEKNEKDLSLYGSNSPPEVINSWGA